MKCGFYYERRLKDKGFNIIIGVDEAGRGPLAGPVVAGAALILNSRFKNRIDDSKKLNASSREKSFQELRDKSLFGIGVVSEKAIDRCNIENATIMAMKKAVESLMSKIKVPSRKRIHILVDGRVKLDVGLACTNIIKGDAKSKSIASASIIAKVTRDRIMSSYDRIYPQYGFLQHKGYPTRAHRDAIKRFGLSLIHRVSFHRA